VSEKTRFIEFEEFKAKIKAIDTKIRSDQLLSSFKVYRVLYEHYVKRESVGQSMGDIAVKCGVSRESLYRHCTNIRLVCDLDLYKKSIKGYFVDIAEYE